MISMSKGPGRVQRRLAEIFQKNPEGMFLTKELCSRVYQTGRVQKWHRVSVLRALKSLARSSIPTLRRRVLRYERDDEWFDSRAGLFPLRGTTRVTEQRPRKG
jgi:hypothetical protein